MQTKAYWREAFSITSDDIDFLKSVLLERETPLSTDELSLILMKHHVETVEAEPAVKKKKLGKRYNPYRTIEVGEVLVFSELADASGELISVRTGSNPERVEFLVGLFQFDDETEAEFVLNMPEGTLAFNVEEDEFAGDDTGSNLTPEEMFIDFGGVVSRQLDDALAASGDLAELAEYWFPTELLIEINEGHLNLAEAILDMMGGGPMSTDDIMEQVGILQENQKELAEFSLNYALQEDQRFDEVGPAGQIMWHLVRMEPEEVNAVPERLMYQPVSYDVNVITEEFRQLEIEIGDALSRLPRLYPNEEVVTLTLTYPYLRTGTLPLTYKVRGFFPTAFEAPRVRFQILDRDTTEEMPGWVVREHGYVYGLADWYKDNDVPIGAFIDIKRLDTGTVEIGLQSHNPRLEWVPTLKIKDRSIQFEDQKRRIGCEYDDLVIINIEDQDIVDAFAERIGKNNLPLEKLVEQMARALIGLNQQKSVHLRTLHSAINIVRRCPPGPIIHALEIMPQFKHFDGAYWQLTE